MQIRILGLHRLKEEDVRGRLRAREWAAYSPEDKALDNAALLASGDFSSVKLTEISVSSSAFRLDIEVIESSPVAPVATSTTTPTWVHVSTEAAPTSTPILQMPPPNWTPKRYARPASKGEPGVLAPPWFIGDIAVKGNKHVTYNVIRSQIKARKGDLYERADLDKDIQTLVGMGNFERVAADLTAMPEKEVPENLLEQAGSTIAARITFLVEEKPQLRKIRFSGQKKLSKGKLSDAMSLKEKDPLDHSKLRQDTDKMLDLYHEKGHIGAAIDPVVSVDSATATADITFNVQEGPRTLITLVHLPGLAAFKAKKVRKQMTNGQTGFWSKKTFQEKKLDEDRRKIEALYKKNGYLDFEVKSTTWTFSDDKSSVTLTLDLSEGRQYRFGETSFSGNEVFASSSLAKALEYKRGKIFDQEKFEISIRNIQQDYYAEKGYLRAQPTPEKTYNEKTGQMDVRFNIVENSIVYIDHIDVEGNKATKTHVLRREIVLKSGKPFQTSKLRKSEEKIRNLGFIDDIQYDFQSPQDPNKVDVTFEVTEGKPGVLTAGAGFSSLDGLIGTLSLQHMNLFGRAQRASIAWQFGARVQDYSLSWRTPWIGDSPTGLGLSLFNTRRLSPYQNSTSAFTTRRLGGSINLGPRFEDDKYLLDFTYTFQKIGIDNIQGQFTELTPGTSISSTLSVELARDTRDFVWDPSAGTRNSIGMAITGGPLFGDIHFWKPFIANSAHFTLARAGDWPLVLSASNRGAYVTQFGETKEVPVFDRFFLGGQDTLRGYSPNGQVGFPGGGKIYDVANIELGFPLARERKKTIVKFVTFFDAGAAWDNMKAVNWRVGSYQSNIKTDVGFGIRFVTPAFPIRLDYGYGLNHRPGERLYEINFGIGNLF
ncbi:MAG: outer membrane protein assembly factor BamA [Elusimicrobia bacterium]|nr:outer membrane protein assembly factor BamA [Elusimicrobiota bacterium]